MHTFWKLISLAFSVRGAMIVASTYFWLKNKNYQNLFPGLMRVRSRQMTKICSILALLKVHLYKIVICAYLTAIFIFVSCINIVCRVISYRNSLFPCQKYLCFLFPWIKHICLKIGTFSFTLNAQYLGKNTRNVPVCKFVGFIWWKIQSCMISQEIRVEDMPSINTC